MSVHFSRMLALTLTATIFSYLSQAQVLTAEDSLTAGLVARESATIISGYGEARYSVDTRQKNAEASLSRIVLFVGHKFNSKISLFTEMELEDALVTGQLGDEDESGKGGISMEQAFVKFNIKPNLYIVGGLFIPRLGIINENHLPTTFNGVDRPFVEELIIPSTWREVGVGLYGSVKSIPGLNYSLALTNGLNSSLFKNGSGIRNGRQLGSAASGLGLGVSGSVLYYVNNFRLQASFYSGGSTAVEKRVADSLQLDSGPFGNPVFLGEVNGQYSNNGLNVRLIAAGINIPNASNINKAYANNTPNSLYGGYAEVAYDLLYKKYSGRKALNVFSRYEYMNLSAKVPSNGLENDANTQQYLVVGLTFKPIKGVAVKADYVHRTTGEPNPALIITPFPQVVPYFKQNAFINLGIAYNF
ncbi:MAG: hypothetical protein QM687_13990 [Ferruginibacter sp.]